VAQTIALLGNLGQVSLDALAIAVLALVLAVILPRTKVGNFGNLMAIAVPSVLVAIFGWDGVQVVRDVGEIPSGVPTPYLPILATVSLDVVSGALAVAAIVLVQGAGVSQSVPNSDGSRSSMSRDFIAQGAANVASGLFRGLPVGGSLSTTALSVLSGARTRWSAIFAGLWMAAIVVAFPDLVSYVAMPTLGALLMVASAATIKPSQIHSIWDAGWPPRLVSVTTFLATLLLPIQVAVGIGVVLSALLRFYASAYDITVVQLVELPDGRIEERTPAQDLPSNTITVLDVYGYLIFAGARTLERRLPAPQDSQNPVVVLRLRGQSTFGATLMDVLANYAEKLRQVNGRLYLSGIGHDAYEQVVRAGKIRLKGPIRAYEATRIIGQSTRSAYADAQAWLVGLSDETPPGDEASGRTGR
jgi:SulP family sulfate permease